MKESFFRRLQFIIWWRQCVLPQILLIDRISKNAILQMASYNLHVLMTSLSAPITWILIVILLNTYVIRNIPDMKDAWVQIKRNFVCKPSPTHAVIDTILIVGLLLTVHLGMVSWESRDRCWISRSQAAARSPTFVSFINNIYKVLDLFEVSDI